MTYPSREAVSGTSAQRYGTLQTVLLRAIFPISIKSLAHGCRIRAFFRAEAAGEGILR